MSLEREIGEIKTDVKHILEILKDDYAPFKKETREDIDRVNEFMHVVQGTLRFIVTLAVMGGAVAGVLAVVH